MEIVEQQLDVGQSLYPVTSPINLPTFLTDQWGGDTAVRTGSSTTATPQAIQKVGGKERRRPFFPSDVVVSLILQLPSISASGTL